MIATVAKDISSTDTLTAAVSPKRVLMAAGGTGGHVYPAIAIADALKKLQPDTDFLFVGTRNRMEWKTVPKYGYKIKSIWISGLHRRLTIQNILFPVKLIVSLIQSFFILKSFKPDMVIACGGFAAGPVGWMGKKLGIPLVLQEQNSFPGVTNRMLAKHADQIFTAFEEADNYLPTQKTVLAGNPVRSRLEEVSREDALKAFNFSDGQPVLLILGGSGGARVVNEAISEHLDKLHNDLKLQIIWQCGQKYRSKIEAKIDLSKYPNVRLLAFIDNIDAAYSAADLVVTRAGAGTCSELMNVGQPAILVPSPNVAGDHQKKNAKALLDAEAAKMLDETQLKGRLSDMIESLIRNKKELRAMSQAMNKLARPDAADKIANEIFSLIEQKENE